MPAVPSENRQGWKKACSICELYDDKPQTTPTPDGLMTYAIVDTNREKKHVIHMPSPETENTVFKDIDDHAVKVWQPFSYDIYVTEGNNTLSCQIFLSL